MSDQNTRHPLVDVDEPNLLEETYAYDLPPRIHFDGPIVEHIDGRPVTFDPGQVKRRDIHITDTTFRDGQQARPPYTVDQMVKIYDLMSRLSGPRGVVRQTEFFLYTRNDREALDRCRALGHDYPECTGWIRAVKGDFRLVRDAGLKETGMLTSSSDYHIFYKLKSDRKRIMETYCEVVDAALEAQVRPRCHLEDVTRADIDGFVLPFVDRVQEMCRDVPDGLKAKFRLCDTMGFGISYPGAELPRSIPKLLYKLNVECGVPSDRLEWHGHNDFHKVHVNGGTAWLYGCDVVNTTLFGFGERTGNPPLEAAIFEYIALKGEMCGIDTTVITELADYMRSIGAPIPDNYPFAGRAFNVTRAGIHAGGLRYHGMAPMVSLANQLGLIEAASFHQLECFEAAQLFAKTEGTIPAPETSHAIRSAIVEAERCRETGEEKCILFNFSGHGLCDLGSYDKYLAGELDDFEYPQEKIQEAIAELPEMG